MKNLKTIASSLKMSYIIAPLIALAICLGYFYPQLEGKVVQQSDNLQYRGMSQESRVYKENTGETTLWTNSMFGGMPTYQINTNKEGNLLRYMDRALRLGFNRPIGYFFVAVLCFYLLMIWPLKINPWISVIGALSFGFTTNNILLFEAGHNTKLLAIAYLPLVATGVLLAFKGDEDKKNYLYGGLIFGLGLGLNLLANHIQMTYYFFVSLLFGCIPSLVILILLFVIKQFREKKKESKEKEEIQEKSSFFQILRKFLQIIRKIAAPLYIRQVENSNKDAKIEKKLFLSNLKHFGKAFIVLLIGGFLAIGSSAVNLWVTYEYSKDTMRGEPILEKVAENTNSDFQSSSETDGLSWDYAMQWSNGGWDLFASFIPMAVGGGSQDRVVLPINKERAQEIPLYWGSLPFTSGPIYFGIIMFFLFLMGLFFVDDYIKWWLLGGTIIIFLWSMGKNFEWFNRLFFDNIPFFNKFRTPNSTLSIASLYIPILGTLVLNNILFNKSRLLNYEWIEKLKKKWEKNWMVNNAEILLGMLIMALFLILIWGIFAIWGCEGSKYFEVFNDQSSINQLIEKRESAFNESMVISLFLLLCYIVVIVTYSSRGKRWFNVFEERKRAENIEKELERIKEKLENKEEKLQNKNEELQRQELLFKQNQEKKIKNIIRGIKNNIKTLNNEFSKLDEDKLNAEKELKSKKTRAFIFEIFNGLTIFLFVGIIIILDLFLVNKKYLNYHDFEPKIENFFTERPVDTQILTDLSHYRVFDVTINPFQYAGTSYFHKSIGGYHAAKLQRYQDIIDYHLSKSNNKVIDMLNTKYFIQSPDRPTLNPNALGNAWFIDTISYVNTPNEEISKLNDFNPSGEVVIHREFEGYMMNFNPRKNGTIQLTEYKPNHLTYSSNSNEEEFAVFSEVWYGPNKGWQAYIDNNPVEHIRVNYVLRGLRIPAGSHIVEFKFQPSAYYTGKNISLGTSLLLILGLVGGIGFFIYSIFRNKNNNQKAKYKA